MHLELYYVVRPKDENRHACYYLGGPFASYNQASDYKYGQLRYESFSWEDAEIVSVTSKVNGG